MALGHGIDKKFILASPGLVICSRVVFLLLMVRSVTSTPHRTNRLAYPCTTEMMDYIDENPWPPQEINETTALPPSPTQRPKPTKTPCWDRPRHQQHHPPPNTSSFPAPFPTTQPVSTFTPLPGPQPAPASVPSTTVDPSNTAPVPEHAPQSASGPSFGLPPTIAPTPSPTQASATDPASSIPEPDNKDIPGMPGHFPPAPTPTGSPAPSLWEEHASPLPSTGSPPASNRTPPHPHHPRPKPPSAAVPTREPGSWNMQYSPTSAPVSETNATSTTPTAATRPPTGEEALPGEADCPNLAPSPSGQPITLPSLTPPPQPAASNSSLEVAPAPSPTEGFVDRPGHQKPDPRPAKTTAPSPTQSEPRGSSLNPATFGPVPAPATSPMQQQLGNLSLTPTASPESVKVPVSSPIQDQPRVHNPPASTAKPIAAPQLPKPVIVPAPSEDQVNTPASGPDPGDDLLIDPECMACVYKCEKIGRTRMGNNCCVACSSGIESDLQYPQGSE